ncbi:MAG: 4'-phosphopantetheinyl transferase superfamily protein [Anaerolineae bacterium]|jgi:4'-phosphopantetheinyl transferase
MVSTDAVWATPPPDLALSPDEVHIWRASLVCPPGEIQAFQGVLTPDELERAERFCFQGDAERFIVARAILRAILGNYLRLKPGQIRFRYTQHGKPYLPAAAKREGLRFNLSHSRGLALYAVTRGREVGIDLESLDTGFDCHPIAVRFFSQRENATLDVLPAEWRREAFFACWTRKEAYIKARGAGLGIPLQQFDVSLVPGEPAELLDSRWAPEDVARWTLRALDPGPGFAAAVAVEGQSWCLRCWQWVR